MINTLCQEAYENSKEKGFHDNDVNIATKLALIHSEVSEALECDRNGKYASFAGLCFTEGQPTDEEFKSAFELKVKDTFEDELADICIRVFDLAGSLGINLEAHIKGKMRYNSLRPKMHGGKKY